MKYLKKYPIIILIVFIFFGFVKPALFFLMMGSIIVYISIESIIFLEKMQKKGIECTGRILSFESDSDGHKTPLVEFTTIEDVSITEEPFVYTSTDFRNFKTHEEMIDKQVSILYDPDDPKKFILSYEYEKGFSYITTPIAIFVGLFFIILSIGSFLGFNKIFD